MATWGAGTWTVAPKAVREVEAGLQVEAVAGSDWWQHTLYGFVHDNGHALLAPWPAEDAIEVSFAVADLTELYDQAGLLIRASATEWIKAGLEITDGVPHLGAVVTHDTSDWSLSPAPDWDGIATVRASRLGDAVVIRARTDTQPWRTIRVASLPRPAALHAGPMLCAPTRAGLVVTFTDWRHPAADTDLHCDPPA